MVCALAVLVVTAILQRGRGVLPHAALEHVAEVPPLGLEVNAVMSLELCVHLPEALPGLLARGEVGRLDVQERLRDIGAVRDPHVVVNAVVESLPPVLRRDGAEIIRPAEPWHGVRLQAHASLARHRPSKQMPSAAKKQRMAHGVACSSMERRDRGEACWEMALEEKERGKYVAQDALDGGASPVVPNLEPTCAPIPGCGAGACVGQFVWQQPGPR